MNYIDTYKASIENSTEFWREQSTKIDWYKSPKTMLCQDHEEQYQWFPDGKLNT